MIATVPTYRRIRTRSVVEVGLALSMLSTSCAVSFDNWHNASNSSAGGRVSVGGGTAETGGTANSGGTNGGDVTGGAGGTGGLTSTETTVWLAFESNQAKVSASPNDSLGINGLVFAYSDGCASVNFDPATRCVSGRTCNVDGQYLNWGMAVEFDFVVTDVSSTPPNAKLTWNPDEHNAIGVAWRITDLQTSRLQLWVPNMAPSWNGTCAVDTCSINSPPDGSAQIGSTGKIYFKSMAKDNWGGSDPPYVYSPAATYSLQFKIPTVIVQSAESYQFCIDQLGVIVRN